MSARPRLDPSMVKFASSTAEPILSWRCAMPAAKVPHHAKTESAYAGQDTAARRIGVVRHFW